MVTETDLKWHEKCTQRLPQISVASAGIYALLSLFKLAIHTSSERPLFTTLVASEIVRAISH